MSLLKSALKTVFVILLCLCLHAVLILVHRGLALQLCIRHFIRFYWILIMYNR